MLNIEAIKEELSRITNKTLEELSREIEKIKDETGLDDLAAIVEYISRHNLTKDAEKLLGLIRVGSLSKRIADLHVGLRGVNIIGRVESIKKFLDVTGYTSKKLLGIILLRDSSGFAQLYIFSSRFNELLSTIRVGDVIAVENIVVSKILSGMPKIIITDQSNIVKLDENIVKRFFFDVPKVDIYDIATILDVNNFKIKDSYQYFHIRGIYLGLASDEAKGSSRERLVKIILGDLPSLARKRIYLTLKKGSILEFENVVPKLGFVLVAHGVIIKRRDNRVSITARNLSSFEVFRIPYIDPKKLNSGDYWGYFITAVNNVNIREYSKGTFGFFKARTLEGDEIRVVIWNENLLELLKDINENDILWVFGQIKKSRNTIEIHVSQYYGYICKANEEMIKLPEIKLDIKSDIHKDRKLTKVIVDFSNLDLQMKYVDVIAKIAEVRLIGSDKLAGIAELFDGKDRIKVLLWEKDLVESLLENENSLVKIYNLRIAKDKKGENQFILMATRRSKVEILARNFEYIPQDYDYYARFFKMMLKDLANIPLGMKINVEGTIVKIERLDRIYLCGKCGNFIVDYDKKICELGHIGSVLEREVIFLILDDGFSELRVIIPAKLLGINENNFLSMAEKLIGKDVCVKGQLKIDMSKGMPEKIFLGETFC